MAESKWGTGNGNGHGAPGGGGATGNGGAARISVNLPFGSQTFGFHIVSDYLQTSHNVAVDVTSVGGNGSGHRRHQTKRMASGAWHACAGWQEREPVC